MPECSTFAATVDSPLSWRDGLYRARHRTKAFPIFAALSVVAMVMTGSDG